MSIKLKVNLKINMSIENIFPLGFYIFVTSFIMKRNEFLLQIFNRFFIRTLTCY